jgi:predicted metal-dependent phosphoesterase TrpH
MFNVRGLDRICRESYSDPVEVHDRLKRMGMSMVTITDHDSIEAAEVLRRHSDFSLGVALGCASITAFASFGLI